MNFWDCVISSLCTCIIFALHIKFVVAFSKIFVHCFFIVFPVMANVYISDIWQPSAASQVAILYIPYKSECTKFRPILLSSCKTQKVVSFVDVPKWQNNWVKSQYSQVLYKIWALLWTNFVNLCFSFFYVSFWFYVWLNVKTEDYFIVVRWM